jgi:nickel-dependent lactate racemase
VRSPKNEGARLDLPYGSHPYPIDLAGRDARVLAAAGLPEPPPVEDLLERALDETPLPHLAAGARVTVVVSDATRHEPRAALVDAVRRRLPGARITVAVATGTHGPARLDELELPDDLPVVNHDGASEVVELGSTRHGTPVRIHRCVVEADLVVATGCIKPHYFAGFGAGAKAIFPGLGEATAIRINHRLKTDPLARAGIVDGNPCREDLEEAVRMVPAPLFLLDGVCGPDERVHAAVAGDVFTAFRAGAAIARPWFTVTAPRAPLVIASDALPVTASLYQAAKIAAAVAPLVDENGTLVMVAQCPDGVGPLDTVNEAIFRIGVLPRLPRGARLLLVSDLDADLVGRTLAEHAASADAVLARTAGPVLVVPHASQLICEPSS